MKINIDIYYSKFIDSVNEQETTIGSDAGSVFDAIVFSCSFTESRTFQDNG